MPLGILVLIPLLVSPTTVADQTAFLKAWAGSDYGLACTHLDALTAPLTGVEVRETAAKARELCGKDALSQGRLAEAERHLKALNDLAVDAAIGTELSVAIRGWKALVAAKTNSLESALKGASGLATDQWPKGLDRALLRMGQQALRDRKVRQAKATLFLLEKEAPKTFGLDDLRKGVWWATEGGRVAFRVALVCFLLLLALTARSLLRTRRRAKALMQAESQT